MSFRQTGHTYSFYEYGKEGRPEKYLFPEQAFCNATLAEGMPTVGDFAADDVVETDGASDVLDVLEGGPEH